MNSIRFKYDPTHALTYGYYVCDECASRFYGGGPPIHKVTCSWHDKQSGYTPTVYHIGPKEVSKIEVSGVSKFDCVYLADLVAQYPELPVIRRFSECPDCQRTSPVILPASPTGCKICGHPLPTRAS